MHMEDIYMETKTFNIKRSFGIRVLLKLIKKNVKGLRITTDGKRFSSNLSVHELSRAVDRVLKVHNIRLKTE